MTIKLCVKCLSNAYRIIILTHKKWRCFIQYDEKNYVCPLNLLRAEVKASSTNLFGGVIQMMRTENENPLCCVACDTAFERHRAYFRRASFSRFAGHGGDTGIWRRALRQGRSFIRGFLAF